MTITPPTPPRTPPTIEGTKDAECVSVGKGERVGGDDGKGGRGRMVGGDDSGRRGGRRAEYVMAIEFTDELSICQDSKNSLYFVNLPALPRLNNG